MGEAASSPADSALAAIAFTGCRLDRAEHLRNDPGKLAGLWPSARVLRLDAQGDAEIAASDDGLALARGDALGDAVLDEAIFLGIDADGGWFALDAAATGRTLDLRRAATLLPAFDAGLFAYACALALWRRRTRHCAQCGAALAPGHAGHVAHCPDCRIDFYPRIDPAVIMLVSDGERALLGRQANWPAGRYSLLAGFVEPGESLEDTVVREVMEEAGVRVRRADYVASQPWPFPAGLMLGFTAQAEPDPPRCNDELEDARWFSRAQLRAEVAAGTLGLSRPESISRWLIERWLAEAP